MLEECIVYGAVICATIYATWRLLPGVLRDALAERCANLAQRPGLASADARSPAQGASRRASGGCGGCTGCATRNAPSNVMIIKDIRKESHVDAR